MLDTTLRPVKERLVAPLVAGPVGGVSPTVITSVGLAVTLGAAVAAWQGAVVLSVAGWLAGRLLDGLDGPVARRQGAARDVGGLIDFTFDTLGYTAIPLALALNADDSTQWAVTAALLASFYLNAVTLGFTSALIEKRNQAAGSPTAVVLPRGLVEGCETIAFFTVALAAPTIATAVWAVMAIGVAATAIERVVWATRRFR